MKKSVGRAPKPIRSQSLEPSNAASRGAFTYLVRRTLPQEDFAL